MKRPILILFTVLTVLSVSFIFYNSTQSSKASNKRSESIAGPVQSVMDPGGQRSSYNWNVLIRKIAHIAEYFLLGLSLAGLAMLLSKRKMQASVGYVLFSALFVGVLDEYIQSFIHRTSSIQDVMIDFAGAACGIFAVYGIYGLYRLHKRKKGE